MDENLNLIIENLINSTQKLSKIVNKEELETLVKNNSNLSLILTKLATVESNICVIRNKISKQILSKTGNSCPTCEEKLIDGMESCLNYG